MKLLLDTHALIWWDSEPAKLSVTALQAIIDPANEVWFSVVNIWEMAIKSQLQKLTLHMPLPLIAQQQLTNGLQVHSIELSHVLAVQQLPLHHRDPFDRLLIAQANEMNAFLITVDPLIHQYGGKTLW